MRSSSRTTTAWRHGAVLLTVAIAVVLPAAAQAATTDPAANAVLRTSPPAVRVTAEGTTRVSVFNENHRLVAHADGARVALPHLKSGVYTAVWSGSTAGTSAFVVDPTGAPALVEDAHPAYALASESETAPRWLAFVAIMTFIGALGLRFLATAPVARRLGDADRAAVLDTADRRLLEIAAVASALAIPTSLWQLDGEKDAPVFHYLWQETDGNMWLARLLLTLLATLIAIPAAVRARRAPVGRALEGGLLVGLAAAACALLTVTLPTKQPPYSDGRAAFTSFLDWTHLMGASIWVGGLVALAVLTVLLRLPEGQGQLFWPRALRRFSLAATVSVGVMVLSGFWTAWIHVGSFRLLFTTLYGQTLLVKLALVTVLVALGGFHQLWLLPRLDAIRTHGGSGSALKLGLRHFRTVIALEAVVGIAILAIVPFLSSSARNQNFQKHVADLTQTAGAISLTPSGLEPGLADYTVKLAGDAVSPVSVAFSSSSLGVPATRVPATSIGNGLYRVTGAYTPIVGNWTARVAAGAETASFTLPIVAVAADLPRSPQPPVRDSTWIWGIAETAIVFFALWAALRLSARVSARRRDVVRVETAAQRI